MLKLAVFLASLALSAFAVAEATTWNCRSDHSESSEVLVKAVAPAEGQVGLLHVADTTHRAIYTVEGFVRRWDFARADMIDLMEAGNPIRSEYALVVDPDGSAAYYDFSGSKDRKDTVPPRMQFYCRKSSSHD